MSSAPDETRCGFIGLIGRPNVGKSTLMNALIGTKVAITSSKPQTTRQKILGIHTDTQTQLIFVDTPGYHQKSQHELNRYMQGVTESVLGDVDVIVMIITHQGAGELDRWIFNRLERYSCPKILLINKMDRAKSNDELTQLVNDFSNQQLFQHIIPISAKHKLGLDRLLGVLQQLAPPGPFLFGREQVTDRDQAFLLAEIVREKCFREAGEELPYTTAVMIEEFKTEEKLTRVSAVIFVQRESHKRMFIGKGGAKLKIIGEKARLDMERLLNQKVFLRLWIKVKPGWANNRTIMRTLGYSDK